MRWRHSLFRDWPPPRRHRHRYHGVLAPNSPLRAAVTAYGREEAASPQAPAKTVSATDEEPASGSPARYLWAMLLARLFASLPLVCPNCGANMRIVAFITDAAPVERILLALGEPPRPPPISPARPCAALSCFAWVPARTILVRSFAASTQLTRPPGTRHPSRCRTGTSSSSPSPTSSHFETGISASPGSRRLLREAVPSAFVSPPSRRTPSPLQHAASACDASREVAPPCFRSLSSHPELRYRPSSAPGWTLRAAWISYPLSVSVTVTPSPAAGRSGPLAVRAGASGASRRDRATGTDAARRRRWPRSGSTSRPRPSGGCRCRARSGPCPGRGRAAVASSAGARSRR